MANKKTQRDFYNDIVALATANQRDDLVEFAKGRIEALDKKIANKDNSKHAKEVEETLAIVYEALTEMTKPVTVSELIKTATNRVTEMSGPKVTAYLKKLVDAGKVVRITDKKTALFAIV